MKDSGLRIGLQRIMTRLARLAPYRPTGFEERHPATVAAGNIEKVRAWICPV